LLRVDVRLTDGREALERDLVNHVSGEDIMRHRPHLYASAVCFALLAGCDRGPDAVPPKSDSTAPAASSPAGTTPAAAASGAASSTQPHPAMLNPSLAKETAPETFKVKCVTTKGNFVIQVTRAWSPNGADRFFNLVKIGYLKDIAFFRNIKDFMVQFGIHGDPNVNAKWRSANIADDPVKQPNQRGYVSFATAGPNTRSTQFFINHGDNRNLDGMGFSPFGQVVEGLDIVSALYQGYGEGFPQGRGPDQNRIQTEGNTYLRKDFPLLDYLKEATIAP
jgi:peptidyl-prolyl cis-trans isomerase A (cyclophilin A)